MRRLRERSGHKSEFKFSKCSDRLRDDFFSSMAECPFIVRALVVEKRRVYSTHLRSSNDAFYNFFIKQLMRYDGSVLRDARVRIDGSGDREFQRALKTYLRRDIEGKIADLRLVDSKRDSLMQLADMCIGAVARSYRDRAEGSRWLRMLRPRIADIWQFR